MKRAIMLMFDSLNRRFLPPYGSAEAIAPNFMRLAEHAATFDNAYAGSLPCMPARRELHTGRYNFLHRGWSPIEPFDDSVPEMLREQGIYTHLVTDHTHYWEDGGATYHTRYSSWEGVRGQEGDRWKADLNPDIPVDAGLPNHASELTPWRRAYKRRDAVNRQFVPDSAHSCQRQVLEKGLEFIDRNHAYDHWFLQIECFDPHEPFFTFEEYLKLYDIPDIGADWDWPPYDRVKESDREVEHLRKKYLALLTQCDAHLGMLLDKMDAYDLWKDTMLIVNTDHGYLLGEHGWWAKNVMPCFDEIVHLPLFIWEPEAGVRKERRRALVQTIDLGPTLLQYFGMEATKDMQGKSLLETVKSDTRVHEYALFGYHGNQLNITDGRYVYMRNALHPEVPVFSYTLMPTNMADRFGEELTKAELVPPFGFTKGMPVLKVPGRAQDGVTRSYGTCLYDLEKDPKETQPLQDPEIEKRMEDALRRLLHESEAPREVYQRMGLSEEA